MDDFSVTNETVRRDLIALERRGILRRTHGGAILVETLGFEPANSVRAAVMIEEKRRIAQAAVDELPADGAVLIDAGTTTALLAEFLPRGRDITVVTNSLHVANTLAGRANVNLMCIGGRVRGTTLCTVDRWAMQALAELRVDVTFLGTNGLTIEHGLTTSDQAEASVKEAMMAAAKRVVLMADHSKVGTEYFHRYGAIGDVDLLITDTGLDADLAEDLRAVVPDMRIV